MYNYKPTSILKGSELTYSYGSRSNAALLYNYGFSLPKNLNKYDSLQIRVLNGIAPDMNFSDPAEMFPTE